MLGACHRSPCPARDAAPPWPSHSAGVRYPCASVSIAIDDWKRVLLYVVHVIDSPPLTGDHEFDPQAPAVRGRWGRDDLARRRLHGGCRQRTTRTSLELGCTL